MVRPAFCNLPTFPSVMATDCFPIQAESPWFIRNFIASKFHHVFIVVSIISENYVFYINNMMVVLELFI